MIRFSSSTKLGNKIHAWGIPAGGQYCPQSGNSEVCDSCYAKKGFYLQEHVDKNKQDNANDWQNIDWENEMVNKLNRLQKYKYFRWFDSGDLYSLQLGEKIKNVIQRTPDVKHWIPTRMYKDKNFKHILDQINLLPNAIVRFSNDTFNDYKGYDSVVVNNISILQNSMNIFPCPFDFNTTNGFNIEKKTCDQCFACWDKNTKLIAYLLY